MNRSGRAVGVVEVEVLADLVEDCLDDLVDDRVVWYVRPDLKEKFDALRIRAGNIRPHSWIVLMVNQWVGLPTGLEREGR